jgi:hypothetical protein
MKMLAVLGILLSSVISGFSQTPAEFRARIETAVEGKNSAAASKILQEFRSKDERYSANNYDYLLGS